MAGSVDDHSPESPSGDNSIRPAIDIVIEKKAQLDTIIEEAKTAFKKSADELLSQTIWIIILCVVVLLLSIYFFYELFQVCFPATWTWQLIYFTAIRIAAITALFWFATYCFKLLNSFIQMYQHNKHKRAVLDSLPGLFGAHSGLTSDVIKNEDDFFQEMLRLYGIRNKLSHSFVFESKNQIKKLNRERIPFYNMQRSLSVTQYIYLKDIKSDKDSFKIISKMMFYLIIKARISLREKRSSKGSLSSKPIHKVSL